MCPLWGNIGVIVESIPPLITSSAIPVVVWWIIGFLVVIAIVDIILYRTKREDISQWIERMSKKYKWFRIIGISLLFLLGWHWFSNKGENKK